ncbi:LysR family transcriptional regulator [Neptunicella sp. SCSIO 80796]|uniref:LysR family transcriptional regulator n=1 Tax=Neptunicella plasticusilytica TaxID=3117012 RepID=UPI003A4E3C25
MDKEIFYLIKVFCSVVEQGSFTLAADRIEVQTPAVSKAISRLEKHLGKRLFNRSTRALELTDVGKLFYAEGLKQIVALNTLLETVDSYKSTMKGTLKITATPLVGEYLVAKNLAEFKRQHASLSLELLFTNEVVSLPSQNIDIALRSSGELEDSSLKSRKLFAMPRVVVASPSYLSEHGCPLAPDELASRPCLNFRHRHLYNQWSYVAGDANFNVTNQSDICCNNYTTLKELCLQGMGIARLFEYQIKQELQTGKLVKVLNHVDWGSQSIHAVYHEKMTDSPKVKAFIEYLVNLNSA